MNLMQVCSRIQGCYQRTVSELFFRRPLVMHNTAPYISFTFDDFPRTALHTGGNILGQFGLRGTFYASFGLMAKAAPTGMIFVPEDLNELFIQGHELGCHTFAHCHSWETSPRVFEDSIIKSKSALAELVPGAVFRSFSYPMVGPQPDTKRRAGRYFACCRGGGQTFNVDVADLNLLKAYFLEKNRDNPHSVKEVINLNCRARGWLIFVTHDISETPTRYGCTPSFFEDIVKYSLKSGARILPIAEALDAIQVDSRDNQ
jgi:peptidoglycan/xylan/chitin deacetylase (PgdA/CDA1 family)